jgi:hypothetical protein
MRRAAELEARRRALLARCELQREELSWRFSQLGPRRWAQAMAGHFAESAGAGASVRVRHPFAWVLAAAALLLLRRPRQALLLLAKTRGALSLLTRAVQVLSLVGALRRR